MKVANILLCWRFVAATCVASIVGLSAAQAGEPVVKVNTLDGSLNQIRVDSSVTVVDSSLISTTYRSENKVSLSIDEASLAMIQGPFNASVGLHIEATMGNNSIVAYDTVLRISFVTGTPYVREHAFFLKNAYRVKATITSAATNAGWNVWELLKVYNEISSQIAFSFSCTINAVTNISHEGLSSSTTSDQLNVSWPNSVGADEYDLEWTYIDSSALSSGLYGAPGSPTPSLLFDHNASRVTVKTTSYPIPLLYDSRGHLFFRVRSVQLNAAMQRVEAEWSTAPTALGRFDFDGHERKLNWQATTTFAEDGKRKTVVQYFDGSLRSRQTVTRDNSGDSSTIVAETFYDRQGRPVIQVLPAPSLDNVIRYNHNFNTGINGSEYTTDQFDALGAGGTYCGAAADSMSLQNGSSRYYSTQNPEKGTGIHRFVPNARRFPFTETQYTQDNTGRVNKQGGVGPVHKIGSGHETTYYYGTPSQEELDGLFGTEAGYSSHYQKTMVKDANGQYSVSYLDIRGRTVATALAGVATQAQLDTLSSYIQETITETISEPKSAVIKDLAIEAKKGLLVAKPAFHTFNYQLSPQSLQLDGCSGQICYDCLYDLNITISGSCNNEAFGGKPFDTTISNFNIASIDGACNAAGFSLSFTKFLTEGSYEITKRLSVSRYGLDYYRDHIFATANTCKTIETFVNEQRSLFAQAGDCTVDCESCKASIGDWNSFRNLFLEKAGISTDTAAYTAQAWKSYNEALAACSAFCDEGSDYDDIRSAMLSDLTAPSGQYANISNTTDPLSIFYSNMEGPNTVTPDYAEITNYRDEEGKPALVFDETVGRSVSPSELSPEVFAQKFERSWAEALLPYHPEFCKLVQYESLKASMQWARRFEKVDTYAEAIAKGYLNPTDRSDFPFVTWSGPHPDPDPLADMSAYTSNLETEMQNFRANSDGMTIWGIATAMTMCPQGSGGGTVHTCYGSSNSDPFGSSLCESDKDMAWRLFRELYLATRTRLISAQLSGPFCLGKPTSNALLAAGHQPHFADANTLLANNGINPPAATGDTAAYAAAMRQRMTASFTASCEGYATQWRKELAGCYSPSTLDQIISKMIEVCKQGSDESHPFGSSSVAPSSTSQYRSFDDVLEEYATANTTCSADLITAPKPYDQQGVYAAKPLWTKPDSCECSRINTLYLQYVTEASSFSGFSDFMLKKHNTLIADSTLSQLQSLCGGGASTLLLQNDCAYLKKPISLPAIFQCNTGTICIDCEEMTVLYDSFKVKFPGVLPVMQPADSIQIRKNRLFENFFNKRLGFGKTSADYISFMNSCNVQVPSEFSCDTLKKVLVDFNKYGGIPHLDAGGCDTTYWKLNYGSSVNYVVPARISDVIQNGYARMPDTTQHPVGINHIDFDYYDDICLDTSGFTFETRIKIPDSSVILNGFSTPLFIWLHNTTFTGAGTLLAGFNYSNPKVGFCTNNNNADPLRACADYPAPMAQHFNDFRVVKIVIRGRQYSLYLDDTLMMTKTMHAPVPKLTGWSVAPYSKKAVIDYIRIYDTAGKFLYNEDFNGCDKLARPKNNCDSACSNKFANYFNTVMGSEYTLQQVSDTYRKSCGIFFNPSCKSDTLNYIRNEFINYFYNHNRTFDSDVSDTATFKVDSGPIYNNTGVPHKEIFKNGIMQFPYMLDVPPYGSRIDYDWRRSDSACINNHYSFEVRLKSPKNAGEVRHGFNIYLYSATDPSYNYLVAFDQVNPYWNYVHNVTPNSTTNRVILDIPEFVIDFQDWRILKFEIIDSSFLVYLDGQLIKNLTFPFVDRQRMVGYAFSTKADHNYGTAFDWVRMYDGNGKKIYQEDFNDPTNFSFFDESATCAKQNCREAFTSYYNSRYASNLTYEQLLAKYQMANIPFNVCDTSSALLCGNFAESAIPVNIDSINNCYDSTFFIYSAATELYKVYTDSLIGSFDDAYRIKCLDAYKMESFTVSHEVSEYHYTLYYYDQAGNLVKTIAPRGVVPNRDPQWLESVKQSRAAGSTLVPGHLMATNYRYNTLNQVVSQYTPDGGRSDFWYDRLGRLALSRNARQQAVSAVAADKLYSYTIYDPLGRITEVGQVRDNTGATVVGDALTRSDADFQSWLQSRNGYKGQITTTVYDAPYALFPAVDNRLIVQQRNLRNRVSYVKFADTLSGAAFNQATFFSYDILGNVDTLLQDYGVTGTFDNIMNANGNRYKKIVYDYDLISGKVNKVSYQPGWADQIFHKYGYDAENRITEVQTSLDGRSWERDARYEYYRHGPLARMVLGDQQVQGIDYAYTLQGWLKGVNSTLLSDTTDMGDDGRLGAANQFVARDAVGFNLNYYDTSDFSAIGGRNPFPGTMAFMPAGTYRPLFNGNISSMAVHNRALSGAGNVGSPLMLYNYRYDQLNRLKSMDSYFKSNMTGNNWSWLTGMQQFREMLTYDGNGNILTLRRHGQKEAFVMDLSTYNYYSGTNRLSHVDDLTPAARYGSTGGDVPDIDDQASGNYVYDEVGNLIRDNAEGITAIKWSVYGKILEISKTASAANPVQKIFYSYDAQGNRIGKVVQKNNGIKSYTWYVRDAQGNVMATYSSGGSASSLTQLPLNVSERIIYGSNRLGMYTRLLSVDNGPKDMSDSNGIKYYRGFRQYELSNHLGNVLATITDRKTGVDLNADGQIDQFSADVTTAQDYYPFGMVMPGRAGYHSGGTWVSEPGQAIAPDNGLAQDISIDDRSGNQPPEYTATSSVELNAGFTSGVNDAFSAYISPDDGSGGGGQQGEALSGGYRYGFNGKENDNEVKGFGNQYDYGFRIYDPRIGRFLSVDPLTKSYPHFTPYQFASNNPILNVDLDGLEGVDYLKNIVVKMDGNSAFPQSDLKNTSYDEIFLIPNGKTANIIHSTPNSLTKIEFNPSSAPGAFTMGVLYPFTQLIATREWSKGWVKFTDNELPSMITLATGSEQNAAGFANTFRHYSWQSLLTAGFGKGFAKGIGDYHEADGLEANKPKGSFIKDNIIDIVNNHYAREYGAGIDFDNATSSIDNFVDYLNGVSQHIASTVDGYKDDKSFDGIRSGKVKMFDKSNKAVQREYSTLQGIKNERQKNKQAEVQANEPVYEWGD